MTSPQMRSPAPRANAGNRAEVIRNATFDSIPSIETEGDFVALLVAWRYRIALPIARAIVALASLGRAFERRTLRTSRR
jgi:hypothetical protein